MIRWATAAIFLTLAACGPTEPQVKTPDPEAAAALGPAEDLEAELPPPDGELRFVGNWATTADQCGSPPWHFTSGGVSTQGHVSCSFDTVTPIPGGYDVSATCHAEGAETRDRIQLTFAEAAQSMMVAGGPWVAGIGLVHCGP